MIRIYHSDPFPLFCKGIQQTLDGHPDLLWLGFQGGYNNLIENLQILNADFLVTNNYLFDDDLKIEISSKLPEIRLALPDLKIVMLTMAADPEIQRELKGKRLIDAFLLKHIEANMLDEILRKVKSGDNWWYY